MSLTIVAEVVIAIMVVSSNAFVLIAVSKFHYLRTPTHKLIASLAVTDLLVALLGIPAAIMLKMSEFA